MTAEDTADADQCPCLITSLPVHPCEGRRGQKQGREAGPSGGQGRQRAASSSLGHQQGQPTSGAGAPTFLEQGDVSWGTVDGRRRAWDPPWIPSELRGRVLEMWLVVVGEAWQGGRPLVRSGRGPWVARGLSVLAPLHTVPRHQVQRPPDGPLVREEGPPATYLRATGAAGFPQPSTGCRRPLCPLTPKQTVPVWSGPF